MSSSSSSPHLYPQSRQSIEFCLHQGGYSNHQQGISSHRPIKPVEVPCRVVPVPEVKPSTLATHRMGIPPEGTFNILHARQPMVHQDTGRTHAKTNQCPPSEMRVPLAVSEDHRLNPSSPGSLSRSRHGRQEIYHQGTVHIVVEARRHSLRPHEIGPSSCDRGEYLPRSINSSHGRQPVHFDRCTPFVKESCGPPMAVHQGKQSAKKGGDWSLFQQEPRMMCMPHDPEFTRSAKSVHSSQHVTLVPRPSRTRRTMIGSGKSDKLGLKETRKSSSALSTAKRSTPPRVPRPRRLPTPELSDFEERAFCSCQFKHIVDASCVRCENRANIFLH